MRISTVKAVFALFVLAPFALPTLNAGMIVTASFASNITNDPNAPAIEAAINAAIAEIEASLLDPINVRITFQEGGGLGSSIIQLVQVPYSSYRAALASDAATVDDANALATLPVQTNSPADGQATMWVSTANARALGLSAPTASDGTISLNTSFMNFDRTTIDPGKYDEQSVVLHEIDEILGLGSGLSLSDGFPRFSRPQDLFRYETPGVRSYTGSNSATSYFSIDGGATDLVNFNQNGGGDYGDWASANAPKVQDAFGTPGSVPTYGVELRNLDVIGYDYAVPEPGTWMQMAAGLGFLVMRRRA